MLPIMILIAGSNDLAGASCADVNSAFRREDLRAVRKILDYELEKWREMDTMAAGLGQPTLLGQMSHKAMINNLAMIGSWCRANTDEALPEVVKDLYAMMRRIYNLYN